MPAATRVERIGPGRARVLFEYEDAQAKTVALAGAIEKLTDDPALAREGNVWQKEVDAPSDLRTVYWFARDGEEDWTNWSIDPSNPNRYVYPAGLEFTGADEVVGSMLELPDAPAYEWSAERDVPRGEVQLVEVRGRRVWIYRPAASPEGVLVLFDGHAYTTLAPAPVVLDNLIAAGRIPPLAAVLPDSLDTESRWRDLAGNAEFLEHVVEDLVPLAGVAADPARTVAAGSSLGGLASAYAALERPDVFGNALVQSGAWSLAPDLLEREPVPVRCYLDVGVLEDFAEPVRAARDALRAQGYDVAYREFPGGHDFFWWRETLAWGLLALLGE
jgi:enterochelin esterase-like enzyme